MLHACPVRDAVRLRALWPGPACAPIYVPCVLGQGAICLLCWERGLKSVRCVTGDGRD